MTSLIYFDTFACSYLFILFMIFGIQVKQTRTIFISLINIVFLRLWIGYFSNLIFFDYKFSTFTVFQAFTEMVICYLIEDFYGYFLHRFMHHNKTLYKYVHQQHHRNQADCFLTAFDVHPVELTGFYFIGWTIGPYLINTLLQNLFRGNMSFLGFNMWLCGSAFFLIWSHTGQELSYMPSTKIHNLHHKYYNCNYGTIVSDYIFNTLRNN